MQQQTTIDFTAAEARPAVSLAERKREVGRVINQWLDSKSGFYSRIADFTVTRRVALRVNLVTLALGVAAIAIEQAPVVSLASAAVSGWLVYRLSKSEGGSKDNTAGKEAKR